MGDKLIKMCKQMQRLFFNLYPSKMKQVVSTDGRRVRKSILFALVLHVLLFFFCLAVVGFIPMLANFMLSCWSYSCYLTIREKEIVIYLVLLSVGFI
jgi:hypothetical protein